MARLSPLRRLLKLFHPEGIPWPGTVVYNLISATTIFQHSYEVIAKDIMDYCTEGSLLDIGTGPGWLLLKLHQQAPQMRLTGMDASSSMVAKTQENILTAGLSHVIDVSEGNASRIPFAESSFDIVVSTGSIHHWKDPIVALNEVHRVLKPGAHALMYDLVSDTPTGILDEMTREFGKLKSMLFWLHGFEEPFYSRQNFEELARPTLFKEGRTRFVSLLCCLILKKQSENAA
jgi:ubiquinone/menaquinone biosynthesis C-methylase UbiE